MLFDVDGTLFLTDDPLAGRALRDTLEERFDVELPTDAIERVDHAGQTALRIARLVLGAAGLADVDGAALREWCPRYSDRYLELLAEADTSGWRAAPHADRVLARLQAAGHRLALLTGNPAPMARARIERLGLAEFFPAGQGAFGCDGEPREALIALARARAGDWPAEATVEIGDTKRDADTAHTAGIRSILVGKAGLADAVTRLPVSSA